MTKTVAEALASTIVAIRNCERVGNAEWAEKHADQLAELIAKLPSGAGIDNGTQLDMDRSAHDCLVFITSFHHMDEFGGYDGWTDHVVKVRQSFVYGLDVTVSGRDRNNIKDHLVEVFSTSLGAMI
jgi:hypothetical protein